MKASIIRFFSRIFRKLKAYNYRNLDIRLIIFVVALTILGINVIASATDLDIYEKKQVMGLFIGIFILIVCMLFDYKFIMSFYWLIYVGNLILLLIVKFAGKDAKGAQRWIDLKFFQLQPSEFAKIFLLIFFARLIWKHKDNLNTIKILALIVVCFILPALLIYKQPDLSTTIVITLLFCVIMFIGGLSYKIIAGVFALLVPIVIVLVYLLVQPNQNILEEYQYNRIVGFYDEDNEVAAAIRYQQENSVMAIGSGGLWGKGLNNNSSDSVKNGNYISEPQTDFIFTIVGEELGFVGTVSVIVLISLIVFECFHIGAHAPDLAGRIFCCGFGALVAFQAFINICVATMLIPNTGLPLPFVSYGLSSLVSLFIGVGIVLNIGLQRKKIA